MNPDILDSIYNQYCRTIYLYLLSLCKNKELAEDLTQESFLKALVSLPDTNKNIRSWLYIVARNLYFDSLKKEKHIRFDTELDKLELASSNQPLDDILVNDRNKLLYNALEHMERQKREILELQYFGDLSQLEIAQIMNIKPNYVRVLALRARRELRLWMEENGYELP